MTEEQETKIDKIVENMSDKEIEDRIKQDEQEKAIEKLTNGEKIDFNTLVRMFKREGIENFVVTKKEYIETVLNILKEKDAEIEKLKQALARNIAKNFTSIMKESAKSKEDLEMLNAGWQIELEKKDKIIDLMATFIDAQNTRMLEDEYTAIKNIYTIIGFDKDKEGIKQYFERKVKE